MENLKKIIFFFVNNFFELLSVILRLDSNLIIFNSTNNNSFNFNSKYLFLYFIRNVPDYSCYFVVNDEYKRRKLIEMYGDHFINTNTVRGGMIACKAKFWVASALETPYFIIPYFKNKERVIYHIGHGVPLKKIGLAEEKINLLKYINRYLRTRVFTHVLSYSPSYEGVMKSIFKNKKIHFMHFGQPRNDQLILDEYISKKNIYKFYPKIDAEAKLVLYAPTWRNYSPTKFFPFVDANPKVLNEFLKENNIYLFLREHPFYSSEINEGFLKKSNILFFNADPFAEIMDYMSAFDKIITDYSSIYLDFLCLDKPVSFIPYDIDKYTKATGFSVSYDEITPGKKLSSFEDLLLFLECEEDEYADERKRVAKMINAKTINNCYENAQFIKSLVEFK